MKKLIARLLTPLLWINKLPAFRIGESLFFVNFALFVTAGAFIAAIIAIFFIRINLPQPIDINLTWLAVIVVFFAMIGSKAFHLISSGRAFWYDPIYHLKQTAFYNQGGQIGALLSIIVVCIAMRVDLLVVLDAAAIGGSLGICIGRLGCYNYGCCYGVPYSSRFSVTYEHPYSKVIRLNPQLKGVPLYPTQLISAAFDFSLFIVLLCLEIFLNHRGFVSAIFVISYNLFRLYISCYRANDDINHTKGEIERSLYRKTASFLAIGIGIPLMCFSVYQGMETHPSPVTWENFYLTLTNHIHYSYLFILSVIYIIAYGVHIGQLGSHFK